MDAQTSREMPRYKCHKEVWALKIAKIDVHHPTIQELEDILNEKYDSGFPAMATITPAEEGYAPFQVDQNYVLKHKPEVGGYYVVYKDGYKSFSPADAFEDGYTRL